MMRSLAGLDEPGCKPANPANLGLQSDARRMPRSRPPHCFLAGKDPSQRVVAIASQKRRRPQIAPWPLRTQCSQD